jgi:hypothetical protein
VRVAGDDTCVEGIAATLTADRRSNGARPPAAKPRPPASGATFVRVDLVGKKAEGGTRGLAPNGEVRRMKCTLAAKP